VAGAVIADTHHQVGLYGVIDLASLRQAPPLDRFIRPECAKKSSVKNLKAIEWAG